MADSEIKRAAYEEFANASAMKRELLSYTKDRNYTEPIFYHGWEKCEERYKPLVEAVALYVMYGDGVADEHYHAVKSALSTLNPTEDK